MEPVKVELREKRREKFCELIVLSLRTLINDMKGNKVYLDENGIPVRRSHAKTTLRKVYTGR